MENKLEATAASELQDLWERRSFIDGFNSVRGGKPKARCYPTELTDARCIELASLPELYIDHWIELTGIGVGRGKSHNISAEGVTFIKWTEEEIAGFSPVDEAEIRCLNRTAPNLQFPCAPSELLWFVFNHAGILDYFMVPDAFQVAVSAAPSGALEKAAPPETAVTPAAAPISLPDETSDGESAIATLLDPVIAAHAGTSEKTAPPAQVVTPASAKPRMTKTIAKAFPPPKGRTDANWNKSLSDPPTWMKEARTSAGSAGLSALWNPAMFALCMVSQRHIGKDFANSIIRREFADSHSEWEMLAEHL